MGKILEIIGRKLKIGITGAAGRQVSILFAK